MATFFVLQGPDKGRTFRTTSERALLGRGSEDIPLTDRTISRNHAEIVPDNGAWKLVDLKSANGTYINGVRVKDPVRLKHGDQIKIGATLIIYSGDQTPEKLSGEHIPSDMIDLDADDLNMDSAILASVIGDDSVILAGPEVEDAARAWRVMSELISAIGAIIDPKQLLERVMDVVGEELPVDRGFILLYDKKGGELKPQVVRYRKGVRARRQKITVSGKIINHVLDNRAAVLCTNAMTDERFTNALGEDSIHDYGLHSVLCAPIMDRDLLLGVIHIDSAARTHSYNEEQLRLMGAIGQMTGLAIQNARLVQQQMQTARLVATGEAVASVSHYIKNILQGIQSGADLVDLGIEAGNSGTLSKGWDIVKRNLDRILQMTSSMLAFSKDRSPNLRKTDFNQLIGDAVQLVQKKAQEREITLQTDFEDALPPIPIDSDGIHQVALGIITNAVDAVSPGDGIVKVATRFDIENGIADLIVADNGPGIPKNEIESIFEPFKSTKGHGGTGLGLAVARKIVREHYGRIVVDSREGEGTTFRVRLPVQELAKESEETYTSSHSDAEG